MPSPQPLQILNDRRSGMGNVYRALDRLTGDQVAVKQIRTEPAVDDPTPTLTNFRLALVRSFAP
jgi:serine/threonine protein kinase